jgi:hypothetical protein
MDRAIPSNRALALAVVCEPRGFASSEAFASHLAEGQRLLASALERVELPDGWAVRLSNDDETFLALARWSADERRCCPFFTFVLEREPTGGALWLRLTGPEGTKQVLSDVFT